MNVDRDGYSGMADVGNGLVNLSIVVPVSRAAEVAVDSTEFFESWIAEHPVLSATLGSATRVGPVRTTGPFATSARRAWSPGVALVGDAAEFFDPFTGEGIYTALRGGEMLSAFAADAVRTPARSNRALREYERARRKEFSGKWLVEKIIGTIIASPPLVNRAAKVLSRRKDMADLLVGVVGDFVPAREVLRPGYLLTLIFAVTGPA
jgi:flavin-dependent dehydrogenase